MCSATSPLSTTSGSSNYYSKQDRILHFLTACLVTLFSHSTAQWRYETHRHPCGFIWAWRRSSFLYCFLDWAWNALRFHAQHTPSKGMFSPKEQKAVETEDASGRPAAGWEDAMAGWESIYCTEIIRSDKRSGKQIGTVFKGQQKKLLNCVWFDSPCLNAPNCNKAVLVSLGQYCGLYFFTSKHP